MKTQAAILVETGEPLVHAELEIPALKPGQVLVEIAYSGVCHTQVLEARGYRGEDRFLPHCLGHEASGTVLEVAAGVTRVKPTEKVVLSWIKGGGLDAGGTTYGWAGKTVNAGGVTTFQRHALVSENRLTPLPSFMPMGVAVLLGCAAPTGMGAVFNVAKAAPGEAVAIFGCGGIGLNACMASAVAGASPVIAVDPNPERRALAMTLGATHAIDPGHGDVVRKVREIVPQGPVIAIEATGIPSVMVSALETVRPQGGRAVVIGNARAGERLTVNPQLFNQGKSLLGTWGGDSVPDRDCARYARVLCEKRFDIEPLLSRPYPLEKINQALDDLEAGRVTRPLIDMSLA